MLRFLFYYPRSTMRAAIVLLLVAAASALPSPRLVPGRHRSVDKSSRLYNGMPAVQGQFPYQVYVLADNSVQFSGALISPLWVLTASLATYTHSHWTLYLGSVNIHANEPGRITDETTIRELPTGNPYDEVALIRLSREVEMSTYVNIAYLPLTTDGDFSMTQATITGWGLDVSYPIEELHYTTVTVVPNTYCSSVLGYLVPPNLMCTNANGIEVAQVCTGDIGAPLVEVNVNKLIGVAAVVMPSDCGSYHPDIFHRVQNYLTWINQITGIPIN